MRRVLITGAAGFVGRHLCRAASEHGWAVRGLDRMGASFDTEVDFCVGDVTSPEDVAKAMAGCEAVIHGAAIAHLWTREVADYERVNVGGTKTVLAQARVSDCRFVCVSSFTTLVSNGPRLARTVDEQTLVAPSALLGPYPRSKRQAELLTIEAARQGADALVVMPSAPVGPGDVSLTPPTQMIRDLAAGALPGFLDCLLDLVDVRRLATGIIAALENGAAGERYILSGTAIRMGALAAMISEMTSVPPPKMQVPYPLALSVAGLEAVSSRVLRRPPTAPLTGVRLAGRDVRFSHDKAQKAFGYDPGSLEEALSASLDWLRANGHLAE